MGCFRIKQNPVDTKPRTPLSSPFIPKIPMRQGSTVLFADVIRAMAAIMIVVIHVSDHAVSHFLVSQDDQRLYWWVATFFNSASRVAVPLFVLVSGYLLLRPNDNSAPLEWLKKRLFRVFVPLLVWIAIYFFWRQLSLPQSFSALDMLRDIARGDPYYHLWFMYMLIGLYLATPILAAYLRGADRLNLSYFVILWFLFTAIPPFITRALYINQFGLTVNVVSGFVGYFMLGYLMRDVVLTRVQCMITGLAVITSIVATAFGTYLLMSRSGGKMDEFFFSSMAPNIIIAALGLFAIAKSVSWEAIYTSFTPLRSIIETLSATSFFLYLSHPLFLSALQSSNIEFFSDTIKNPIWGIPLTVFTITCTAILVRYALSRIPGLNVKIIFG